MIDAMNAVTEVIMLVIVVDMVDAPVAGKFDIFISSNVPQWGTVICFYSENRRVCHIKICHHCYESIEMPEFFLAAHQNGVVEFTGDLCVCVSQSVN